MKRITLSASLALALMCGCADESPQTVARLSAEVEIVKKTRDILNARKKYYRQLKVIFSRDDGMVTAFVGWNQFEAFTFNSYAVGFGSSKDEAVEDLRQQVSKMHEMECERKGSK